MKKILIIQPIHQAGIELIKKNPEYEFEVVENTDIEFLKSKVKDCDGVSIRTAKLPGEVINCGNKLKIISRHGVGYDNIDLETSKKNNLTLAITPKFYSLRQFISVVKFSIFNSIIIHIFSFRNIK